MIPPHLPLAGLSLLGEAWKVKVALGQGGAIEEDGDRTLGRETGHTANSGLGRGETARVKLGSSDKCKGDLVIVKSYQCRLLL